MAGEPGPGRESAQTLSRACSHPPGGESGSLPGGRPLVAVPRSAGPSSVCPLFAGRMAIPLQKFPAEFPAELETQHAVTTVS